MPGRRGEHGAQVAEGGGMFLAAEGSADRLPDFHHAQVPFGLVVVEVHAGVFEEAHHLLVALLQEDEQVQRRAPFDPPPGSRRWGGRFGVEGQPLEDDFGMAHVDTLAGAFTDDAAGTLGPGAFAFGELLDFKEQRDHFPGPGLVHLLLEVDQFAQDVGGAEFVEASENAVAERKSWTSRPLKHCDQILVMSVGSVLERGNHEELIAKPCGLYGSLARLPLE